MKILEGRFHHRVAQVEVECLLQFGLHRGIRLPRKQANRKLDGGSQTKGLEKPLPDRNADPHRPRPANVHQSVELRILIGGIRHHHIERDAVSLPRCIPPHLDLVQLAVDLDPLQRGLAVR